MKIMGTKPKVLHKTEKVFLVFILLGSLLGSIMLKNDFLHDFGYLFIEGFFPIKYSGFLGSMACSLLFLAVTFYLGFSPVSRPIICLLPILRGVGMGLAAGYVYLTYGVSGILLAVSVFLPNALITAGAVLLGVREAVRMSEAVWSAAFCGGGKPDVRLYAAKFAVLCGICFVAALLHGLVCFLMAGHM